MKDILKSFFIVAIVFTVLSLQYSYAISDTLHSIQTANNNAAQNGKFNQANLVSNVNKTPPAGGELYNDVPGHTTSDGYVPISNDSSVHAQQGEQACLLAFNGTCNGSDNRFDSSAYADVRVQVSDYVFNNPGATPSQINDFVQQVTDGAMTYLVVPLLNQNEGVALKLDNGMSYQYATVIGTTTNPDGSVSLPDIAGIPFPPSITTVAEAMDYLRANADQYRGLNDIIIQFEHNGETPGDPPGDKDKPEEPPVQFLANGRYYHTNGSGMEPPISHLVPSGEARIFSEKDYNVERAIPTSENLKFEVRNLDDCLYNINISYSTYTGKCSNIPIYKKMEYKYTLKCYTEGIPEKKSGDKIIREAVPPQVYYEPKENTIYEYVKSVTDTGNTKKTYSCSPSIWWVDKAIFKKAPVGGDVIINLEPDKNSPQGFSSSYTGDPQGDTRFEIDVPGSGRNYGTFEDNMTPYNKAKEALSQGVDTGPVESTIKSILNNAGTKKVTSGTGEFKWRGIDVNTGGVNSRGGGTSPITKESDSPRLILTSYQNKEYVPETIVNYPGFLDEVRLFPNHVKVHTPTINKSYAEKTEEFINQKINIEPDVTYLQLDKSFKVAFPNKGTHISEDGYETRDYLYKQAVPAELTNWGLYKDVKFDFDVYLKYKDGGIDKLFLLRSGDWLCDSVADVDKVAKINTNTNCWEYEFLIPVWAPEGKHTINTQVVAENYASMADSNGKVDVNAISVPEKNTDPNKYIATKDISIEIIGKIYDLQVHESVDVDWNGKVQGSKYNNKYVTASEFPFGNTYTGAGIRSQNANSAYKYAPKLGYTFSFNFKTKGRKSSEIQIDVTKFSFVSKDGGNAETVDLWYKPTGSSTYIKIDNNIGNLKIAPNDDYLRILPIEKQNSQKIYPIEKRIGAYANWIGNVPYNYSNKVAIGTFKKMLLPHTLRFVFDNFDEYVAGKGNLYKKDRASIISDATLAGQENGDDRVVGSVGRWYTGYTLPQTTVAVRPGSNPNTNPGDIKKNGYILVSFGIKSRDRNGNEEYLLYHGPETKLPDGTTNDGVPTPDWTTNTPNPIKLPTGKDANVPPDAIALYESNYSAATDRVQGMDY